MSLSPQALTERWIEGVVVSLNLCPFAKRVVSDQKIRFVTTELVDSSELISLTCSELEILDRPDSQFETTVIIASQLADFSIYWQILQQIDNYLDQTPYRQLFQIASFHPDYRFAGTDPGDRTNYTNRSPLPLFHIIRESSIDEVRQWYPNLEDIPHRNQQRLRAMNSSEFEKLFAKFCKPENQG